MQEERNGFGATTHNEKNREKRKMGKNRQSLKEKEQGKF